MTECDREGTCKQPCGSRTACRSTVPAAPRTHPRGVAEPATGSTGKTPAWHLARCEGSLAGWRHTGLPQESTCLKNGYGQRAPLIPALPSPTFASPSGPSGPELWIWVLSWPVPSRIAGRQLRCLPKVRLGTGQLGTQTPSSGPDGPVWEAKLGRGEPELRDHGQGTLITLLMHYTKRDPLLLNRLQSSKDVLWHQTVAKHQRPLKHRASEQQTQSGHQILWLRCIK